ncbi:MAG TPA: glycosyltransferase, partial [Acidobacteriota bacterium]
MTESKPRRIFITADTIGGVWTYTMELARALAAQGIDIALATMGRTLSYDQRRKCRQIPRLQVYESAYKLEWMENPWDDIESAKLWLLNLEKLVCPDVVHLNQFS